MIIIYRDGDVNYDYIRESFGKENCVAYCDVLIRRNYEVINADEHFYHL